MVVRSEAVVLCTIDFEIRECRQIFENLATRVDVSGEELKIFRGAVMAAVKIVNEPLPALSNSYTT
jgi:hypothetical protein